MKGIIFLDRDGVINKYPGNFKYIESLENFVFLPRVKEAIKQLTEADYRIFVISNQAGVSKGIYSQKKLDQITKRMLEKIHSAGGKIDKVFYCIHRKEENCLCRKPKTGLIEMALKNLGINKLTKKNGYFVGDSVRDVTAGKNAHCTTILVLSGRENLRNKRSWKPKPDYISKDLLEASKIILDENPNHLRFSRAGAQALR